MAGEAGFLPLCRPVRGVRLRAGHAVTYVDGPFAEHRGAWAGGCHLAADTLEELHGFAASLGLRPEWLHGGRAPHYDLTARKRAEALARGAVAVRPRELLRVSLTLAG